MTIGPVPDSNPRNGSVLTVRIPGEPADRTYLSPTVRPLGSDGTVQWDGSMAVTEPIELTFTYRRVGGTAVIEVTRGFK
ncbi:MAG: hypothetical protein U5K70_00345 [Halodesulfurarchaeum sp.]|nr:hypothetical protein [Halodesulfurarchaeum sp.]